VHGLKQLARVYVDETATDAEDELMREIKLAGGKHKGDWLMAPWRSYAKYSALDPWYTLQLHLQFIERINTWAQPEDYPSLRSLYETEQWLLLALRDMEERGIRVSRRYLERWQRSLHRDLVVEHASLVELAGRDINWNSPQQLQRLLYGTHAEGGLGLSTRRRTKSGKVSTDKTALVALDHPIGAALLRYRKIHHSCYTGAQSILDSIDADDAVHCDFNQLVDTGRMSCRDPNLQGQDRTSGVRKGFKPRKGLVLRMADYSQVEMRYAAHFADEPFLIQKFNEDSNFDAHTATAMRMFGTKTPTSNERKLAKDVNFATIYGAGEDKQAEMLMTRVPVAEAIQACKELGYTPGYAESPHRALVALLREKYQEMMPAMRSCARREGKICEQRGFVVDAYGSIRYLDTDESYKAFNTKIQGSAAHRAKQGLVAVYRELQLGTGELALLLQIHDEIIYESEGRKSTDRRVIELLNDTTTFRVPIIADMSGSDTDWQSKTAISLSKRAS
jgi:DNA polymerase I